MRGKNTIIINGKLYDAVSGLPVAAPDKITRPASSTAHPQAKKPTSSKAFSDIGPAVSLNKPVTSKPVHAAAKAHRTIQKSQTLRRDTLKRPTPAQHTPLRHKPAHGHVAKSEMISKFAPHPQPLPAAPAKKPVAAVAKPSAPVAKHHVATQKKQPVSSREHKEKLIAERLASIDTSKRHTEAPKVRRGLLSGHPRVSSVVTACIALVVLGGYLTYLNMPNLSVRVAAAQSGVSASFPQYKPDGYRFDGPVAYAPGEVTINFQANGGPQKFTVKQKNSSWDSQAVLDNYVSKKADNDYITSSESGLTIYTFDNKAAWVNKGIFYSIDGDAPLSSEQILRIASSM